MDLKNHQNFTLSNLCCLLFIQKVLNSNNNSTINLTPNLIGSFLTLWFFFEDVSIYKHLRDKVCKTSSIVSHNLHIWYYDILPNLIIFRLCLLFLKFLKNSEMGCLPSAHLLTLGKQLFAECQPLGTQQTTLFAECFFLPSVFCWHLANRLFAECPWFGTRQSVEHSAKSRFPVVTPTSRIVKWTWSYVPQTCYMCYQTWLLLI